ncbi:MAG: amidohydrolase family protein [Sphingomicrobium sp.]
MLIDAHQHYWIIGKHGQEWPTADLGRIHRDFEPSDWEAEASAVGVESSILVQSQPSDADTDWLLELADATPSVVGVVGWADLKSPDAPARIGKLAQHRQLKGLRPMLQSLPDSWINDPVLDPSITAMLEHGLRFDALVLPTQLPNLRRFAMRWPELSIVIDHGAKPAIRDKQVEPWATEMSELAKLPNVMCKLSGLMTEKAPAQGHEALAPFVQHLCATFGPERLMWGSDWPVVLLAARYAEWFEMARDLGGFSEAELGHVFGGTATRFYGLDA